LLNFECLEIPDGGGRYFQIQKSPHLCNAHVTLFKVKNLLNRNLKLYLGNKTANINGKNWPVYNQVSGRQSHNSKTAKITLVGLHPGR